MKPNESYDSKIKQGHGLISIFYKYSDLISSFVQNILVNNFLSVTAKLRQRKGNTR